MKKITLVFTIIAVLCLLVSTGNAQWEKGKSYIGPRVGIGINGSSIAFGAGYEYGVTEEIGVGALVDYYQWTYDWYGSYGGKYTYIVFGAQGNYHFGKILKWDSKLDPFAGVVLGYESVSWKWDNEPGVSSTWSANASQIVFGGQAGIRYFFSPSIALYAQAGFGITYVKAGIDFKF
jgi:hypothetical protein